MGVSSPAPVELTLGLNERESRPDGSARLIPTPSRCSSAIGRASGAGPMSDLSCTCRSAISSPSISFPGATRVHGTAGRGWDTPARTPTSPDIFLPWSDDSALGGWSAKMFLHQVLRTSRPHWQASDTERLLSASTLRVSRGKVARATSLSRVLKPTRLRLSEPSEVTPASMRCLVRKCTRLGRSLRVLVCADGAALPMIVSFGRKDGSDAWTARSARPSQGCQLGGLLECLRALVRDCAGTRCLYRWPRGWAGKSPESRRVSECSVTSAKSVQSADKKE